MLVTGKLYAAVDVTESMISVLAFAFVAFINPARSSESRITSWCPLYSRCHKALLMLFCVLLSIIGGIQADLPQMLVQRIAGKSILSA
jgi:hypothetical protein